VSGATPLEQARAFLAEDPDPDTRAELQSLVKRAEAGDTVAQSELQDRFSAPLLFGTAGLRGKVEAGLARGPAGASAHSCSRRRLSRRAAAAS
jgi:phosphomannomutase